MPFTFSHPAIVLPLTFLPRHWFSLTGLVIGSLAPDFEYFMRMKIQSSYSHTTAGLFWFDLPLGILVAFIFHNLIRDSLFDNLPKILKSRLNTFKRFDWNSYFSKNWYIVTISVLIGAVSHIFWDSFTHNNGYFVQTIPTLSNTLNFFGTQVTVLKILQHSGTLLGGFVIAFALLKLPAEKNVNVQLDIKYWSILTVLAMVIFAARLLSGFEFKMYGNVIVSAISAAMISLTLTPWLTRQKI